MKPIIKFLLSACTLLMSTSTVLAAPDVLVTIKPIHSLVAGVMKGVGEPTLLMTSNQSLHHYSLRPSERRLISQASLLFWVGPELEVFLPRLLSGDNVKAKSVALINSNQLIRLEMKDKDSHKNSRNNHPHQTDPHIWLSTQNAVVLVDEIAHQLITIDAENKTRYQQNQSELKAKIVSLSARLKAQLNNTEKPYITFHNAIRYFEDELKLNNAGSIQPNPESQPSAQHISNIVQRIEQDNITCLLYDQAEKPRLINSLQNQTHTKSYAIDPTGMNTRSGENAWFEIMENIASNLNTCLKN